MCLVVWLFDVLVLLLFCCFLLLVFRKEPYGRSCRLNTTHGARVAGRKTPRNAQRHKAPYARHAQGGTRATQCCEPHARTAPGARRNARTAPPFTARGARGNTHSATDARPNADTQSTHAPHAPRATPRRRSARGARRPAPGARCPAPGARRPTPYANTLPIARCYALDAVP